MFAKERVKSRVSRLLCNSREIKICQRCFLCHSVVLCKTCNKCPNCCHKFTCRGQTSTLLGNFAKSGWATPSPFGSGPNSQDLPTVISRYVNPHRNSYLTETLHQLIDKNAVELVRNNTSLGFSTGYFYFPSQTKNGDLY